MSTLLIQLNAAAGDASQKLGFARVSAAGQLIAHGLSAAALLPRASGDEVLALLPATQLSWHEVSLPKGVSSAKLPAVLAGLLEEQLLDEPSNLHLALCSIAGKSWVAVCSKEWLQGQLQNLQNVGCSVRGLLPQFSPSSIETPSAYMGALDLASKEHSDAVIATLSNAQGVMTLPVQQIKALVQSEHSIELCAEPAVAALAEKIWGQRINVLPIQEVMLRAWQISQAPDRQLQLAQGAFDLSTRGQWLQNIGAGLISLFVSPQWRALRWGLGVLLIGNLIGLNAWSYKQTAALADQQAQINQVFAQSFPQIKAISDAPLQMQREMANLRQAQGQPSSQDFESLLSRFSKAYHEEGKTEYAGTAIDFEASQLRIEGLERSSEALAQRLAKRAEKIQSADLSVQQNKLILTIQNGVAKEKASPAGAKP